MGWVVSVKVTSSAEKRYRVIRVVVRIVPSRSLQFREVSGAAV